MIVVVRAAGNPAALAEPLRREVARLDRDVAVGQVATLSTQAAASIATQRFGGTAPRTVRVRGGAPCRAGNLRRDGVHGGSANARIGVRLALGATTGVGLRPRGPSWRSAHGRRDRPGPGGCRGCGGVMRSLLFDISPTDPVTFASVPLLLGAVALIACALPALRASRSRRSRHCAATEAAATGCAPPRRCV